MIDDDGPKYTFKLTHGKQTYEITFPTGRSIADLKQHIESLTGVHANMQKLLYKGPWKGHSFSGGGLLVEEVVDEFSTFTRNVKRRSNAGRSEGSRWRQGHLDGQQRYMVLTSPIQRALP